MGFAAAPGCNTCAAPVLACNTCNTCNTCSNSCNTSNNSCNSCNNSCDTCNSCAATPKFCNTCGCTQRWTANLASTGNCGGGGDATFQLTKECDKLRYWVNVCDMTDVTTAQIRLVSNGCDLANAPVVATLYCDNNSCGCGCGGGSGCGCGCWSGRLTRGNLCCSDLQGPLAGQPLTTLMAALTNGTAVITVGTCSNPCAQIAGVVGCEAPC